MRYKGDQKLTPEERFWNKVRKTDDCWIWTAVTDHKGYGRFQFYSGSYKVTKGSHRYAYELLIGEIPEGLFILHTCNNRRCVNPDHLKLGTAQDNTNQMIAEGRHRNRHSVLEKGYVN